jgi:DNA-binding response OmpR family regulator
MNAEKRNRIRTTLRTLAQAHAAMIEVMERAMTLLNEELALDALTFWKKHSNSAGTSECSANLKIDHALLQVTYRGKSCFLGSSLLFRLVDHLARNADVYVTHDELLETVWDGLRSDSAIRSAVKRLRAALRRDGLGEIADAIDGSAPGRYVLRLSAIQGS